MLHRIGTVVFLWVWIVTTDASADQTYLKKIKPLFESKCVSCHGAVRQEAGLRLDAGKLIHQGSKEGSVLDLSKPTASRLWERVQNTSAEHRMPPPDEGVPLNGEELLALSQWIEQGAPFPNDESYLSDPLQHWAYRPIPVALSGIDELFDRLYAAHQLKPLPIAKPEFRIRRLYFDLIGLPPSASSVIAFTEACESGNGEAAYREIVDQLLSSPQYGERWGRHWMDVWRYSDWDGYKNELRGSQRHIWHWRDWIVESLNNNKPYDQMIREMLAADEIDPTNRDMLRATGFLARNFHVSNRNIWLDATVEHTAKAFLGLTINCAKCHDHKYDPIAQQEYYQFRAIFEPYHVRAELLPGITDEKVDGIPRAFDANPAAETFIYARGDEKRPEKDRKIDPSPPKFLVSQWNVSPISLPLAAYYPGIQTHVTEDQCRDAEKQLQTLRTQCKSIEANNDATSDERALAQFKVAAAESRLQSLRQRSLAELAKFQNDHKFAQSQIDLLAASAAFEHRRYEYYEAKVKFEEAKLEVSKAKLAENPAKSDAKKAKASSAEAEKKLEAAKKSLEDAIAAFDKQDQVYPSLGKIYPRESTGRRTALANWITSTDNPLAARVAVNHIWTRHFGQPIVDNLFDFGLKTSDPPLRAILDSLARQLIENGWDLKQLHRQIVMSTAYQRQSLSDSYLVAQNQERDADNHYLWHFPQQRLDAEVIRDALLSIGGSLDLTVGGPDIDYQQGDKVFRRSIYFRHAYEKQMTFLVTFDAASPLECYRRSPSIIPQQALAMANGNLARAMARRGAQRISNELPETDRSTNAFIRSLFMQTLNRFPSENETEACEHFLAKQRAMFENASAQSLTPFAGGEAPLISATQSADQRARESLMHVLLNHNDFITIR